MVELDTLTDIKYKYRYIITMSRLIGSFSDRTRLDSDEGMILLQESAANKAPKDGKDYLDTFSLSEISETYGNTIELTSPQNSYPYTHFSIYRTKNYIDPDADFAVVSETFVYVKDIPVVSMGSISGSTIDSGGLSGFLTITTSIMGIDEVGSIFKTVSGAEYLLTEFISDAPGGVTYRFEKPDGTPIGTVTEEEGSVGAEASFDFNVDTGENGDYVLSINSGSRDFQESDIGKQVFFKDGITGIITRILPSTPENQRAVFYAPDDISSILGTNTPATIGISGRNFYDTISDEVLTGRIESGDALFFLQTRFFDPLPDGTLGAVKGGSYFAGAENLSEYYYSQMGQLFRTGSYRPDIQTNSKPSGIITRLTPYPESLVIFTNNETYYVDTTIIDEGGETAVGESIPVYAEPRLVTNRIGCPAENCSARHDNGGEFIFTNEPAVRYFNGYQYSDDLSLNKVKNKEINQFDLNVVMEYDKYKGLNIWGVKNRESN